MIRIARIASCIVAAVGASALLGWLTGRHLLASIRPGYIPMAPNTATAFLLLGVLVALKPPRVGRAWTAAAGLVGGAVALVGGLRCFELLTGIDVGSDAWLFTAPDEMVRRWKPAGSMAPVGRMALPTGACFFVAGLSVAMYAHGRRAEAVAASLGIAVASAGLVFALGYLYGSPLLYAGQLIPMALNTAIGFAAFGISIVASVPPHHLPLRAVWGPSVRARLLRAFLPFALITVCLAPWLTNLAVQWTGGPYAALYLAGFIAVASLFVTVLCTRLASRVEASLQRAERGWQESQERFWAFVEHSPAPTWIKDAEGRYVYVSSRFERAFGREAFGATDADLWPSDVALRFRAEDAAVQHDGKARERLETLAGNPWLFLTFPVHGSFVGGMALDVGDRLRAQEALQEERDFITAVLDSADVLIVVLDAEGRIVRLNRACERTLLFSEKEVKGKPFVDVYLADGRREIPDTPGRHESAWRTNDGRTRKIVWSVTRLSGRDGALRHTIATGIDVTDLKRLEEQLHQTQKMESIGRLAGGVAHDFNNMLLAILGFTELALADLEPASPVRAHLKEVMDAGQRAAALTRQLLVFSRKQTLQRMPVDLNQTILHMDKMLSRLIGEDIRLVTRPAKDLGAVLVDSGQMEQVILNLVVNARDAMPHGGTITIETANVEVDPAVAREHANVAPGPYVELSVSDDGTGMTAETQSHLFEPFFTTKEKGRGTGLGLSTVYGIVQQNSGHIRVSSELGRGTKFTILLPRGGKAEGTERRSDTPRLATKNTETILVVEDESAVRSLIREILRKKGYRVLEAADGAEGLRLFEAEPAIHLLLTDWVLPGMGGPEVVRRALEMRPELKVLFMSGYTDRALADHRPVDARFPFLQKPFTSGSLLAKVRATLDGA